MNDLPNANEAKKLCPQVATLYRAAVSFGTNETRLIWSRYTGFLVINGFFTNALLSKWVPPQNSSLLLIGGALALLVNAVWHTLNFSGWLNQIRWYRIAGNLDESLGQWKLPTDDFKEKVKRPCGWIYWIAQLVPMGFSIGAAICLAKGLARPGLGFCEAGFISACAWIVVAVAVVLIEYKAITKWKGAEVV